mgnify:CR=1 FL=1
MSFTQGKSATNFALGVHLIDANGHFTRRIIILYLHSFSSWDDNEDIH